MNHPLAIAMAASAGVLLPKLLPAFIFPREVPAVVATWLRYLPPATLGAFTAVSATGLWTGRGSLPVFAALAVAGTIALLTRRTFTPLAAGWALLVGLHLAGIA